MSVGEFWIKFYNMQKRSSLYDIMTVAYEFEELKRLQRIKILREIQEESNKCNNHGHTVFYQELMRFAVEEIYALSKEAKNYTTEINNDRLVFLEMGISQIIDKQMIKSAENYGALRYMLLLESETYIVHSFYVTWTTAFSFLMCASDCPRPRLINDLVESTKHCIPIDQWLMFSRLLICVHNLFNVLTINLSNMLQTFISSHQ